MSIAIGLSGAQGAGKSSLLKELMARGWHLDTFRVSRAVQKELGWSSLNRVMETPSAMMAFQEEIFNQKYRNDSSFKSDSKLTLTERTFADIFAYTALWTWKFVDAGMLATEEALTFLKPFRTQCANAQLEIYGGTILLPLMDHIIWEDDVNRASKGDATRVYGDIATFLGSIQNIDPAHRAYVIAGRTVQERAAEVELFLHTILGKSNV